MASLGATAIGVSVMLGDARRLEGRAVGELPIRRFLAALDSLPAKGSMVRERPLEGGGLVCENTPGPEPVPGPRPGGSLPPRPEPLVCHGLPSGRAARRCCTAG